MYRRQADGFNPVIQAGFEPTTHSLEGCCSIQLSYWTPKKHFLQKVMQR